MKFYCRSNAQEKQHFRKSHFYCRRFFPGNAVTIILDNSPPPSTLQGVGVGGRKIPKIIVAENYCHFGASSKSYTAKIRGGFSAEGPGQQSNIHTKEKKKTGQSGTAVRSVLTDRHVEVPISITPMATEHPQKCFERCHLELAADELLRKDIMFPVSP